jgi:hypothetical protein
MVRLTQYIACTGEKRISHRLLVGIHERDHLQELGVDRRIILKWIIKKWAGRAWTGLVWLRIGAIDRLL